MNTLIQKFSDVINGYISGCWAMSKSGILGRAKVEDPFHMRTRERETLTRILRTSNRSSPHI